MDTNSTKGYPMVEVHYQSSWLGELHINVPAERNSFSDILFFLSGIALVILCGFFGARGLLFFTVLLPFLFLFLKNHFKKLLKANCDGTFFNFNPLHMTSQNQNMPQDFYSQNNFTAPIIEKVTSGETLGVEKQLQGPQYYIDIRDIDIHGAETAELRERIKKLEKQLEYKTEHQIIPIQFLESEKLELKQPIVVSLCYYPKDENYLVDCIELNIYGEGRDEYEAIEDFKIVLEENYFLLKKDKDNLGPTLEKEWRRFDLTLREKSK